MVPRLPKKMPTIASACPGTYAKHSARTKNCTSKTGFEVPDFFPF